MRQVRARFRAVRPAADTLVRVQAERGGDVVHGEGVDVCGVEDLGLSGGGGGGLVRGFVRGEKGGVRGR